MDDEVYVNVVEYGVFNYPHKVMERDGWRFMRIEYHGGGLYAFLETHVWMPPNVGSWELEQFIEDKLKENKEEVSDGDAD